MGGPKLIWITSSLIPPPPPPVMPIPWRVKTVCNGICSDPFAAAVAVASWNMEYEWVPPPLRASIRDHLRGLGPLLSGCKGVWSSSFCSQECRLSTYISLNVVSLNRHDRRASKTVLVYKKSFVSYSFCLSLGFRSGETKYQIPFHIAITQGRNCYVASKRLLGSLNLARGWAENAAAKWFLETQQHSSYTSANLSSPPCSTITFVTYTPVVRRFLWVCDQSVSLTS